MTQKRKNRGQTSLNGEVVQAFLSRFPNTASKTLAEMIYKEHSQLFTDVEHARSRVRYYRGALGKKNRNRIIEKEHFRVTDTFNPFNLPEPDESRQVLPYKLPSGHRLRNTKERPGIRPKRGRDGLLRRVQIRHRSTKTEPRSGNRAGSRVCRYCRKPV